MHNRPNFFAFAAICLLAACRDDPPELKPLVVPAAYVFDDADFSPFPSLISQMEELLVYCRTAQQPNTWLSAQVLMAMVENSGGNADGNFTETYVSSIGSHLSEDEAQMLDDLFEKAIAASQSNDIAAHGVAGRASWNGGLAAGLFDSEGTELITAIEHTLLGALLMGPALNHHLGDSLISSPNTGAPLTEMERHWDKAYAAFTAPRSFPADADSARYWSKYFLAVEHAVATGADLSEAFRLGRAAISAERYPIRDSCAAFIAETWELAAAASAVKQLNNALENLDHYPPRVLAISKARGFAVALETLNNQSHIAVDKLLSTVPAEADSAALAALRKELADAYGLKADEL